MTTYSLFNSAGRAVAAGAVALVFAFGVMSTGAHAAASGSFTKSCKDIVDDDSTVNASCKKRDGSYKGTSLAYKICQGDISNNNGTLQCTPQGSFKKSCNMISWNASFLTANCRKIDGKYIVNSGFNYNNCLNNSQDIANIDGSLQCN
jgi:hypothetical protein